MATDVIAIRSHLLDFVSVEEKTVVNKRRKAEVWKNPRQRGPLRVIHAKPDIGGGIYQVRNGGIPFHSAQHRRQPGDCDRLAIDQSQVLFDRVLMTLL